MDEAAVEGHKIYQQRRSLDAISTQRKLTIEEKKLIEKLINEEKNFYINAWKKLINKKWKKNFIYAD
ncbi:hypothetical protein [Flavobacterium sp.]|uniref:hypothetical protein n=1 Tax=Flavobacterium sp. TaxID=239 RepID=UPI00404843C8